MSIYEFISIVLALAALAGTYGQKIWDWICYRNEPPKVNISAQDSIGISHHLGRIFFFLRIQIENTGRKPVAISKIDCVIRQGDVGQANLGPVQRYPATVYYSESESPNGERPIVFVGTIRLNPGEAWAKVIRAYGSQTQENEEKALEIDDAIAEELGIIENQRRLDGSRDTSIFKIENAELVKSAQDFARENFNLIVGKYSIYIATIGTDKEVLAVVKYSFSITNKSRLTLVDIIDQYKHGTKGLPYFRSGIEPRLSESITGNEVLREYLAIAATQ